MFKRHTLSSLLVQTYVSKNRHDISTIHVKSYTIRNTITITHKYLFIDYHKRETRQNILIEYSLHIFIKSIKCLIFF